jgi:hypothetical protein
MQPITRLRSQDCRGANARVRLGLEEAVWVRDAPLDSRGFHVDGLAARLLVSPRQATGITATAVVSYSIGARTLAEVARSAATFSP